MGFFKKVVKKVKKTVKKPVSGIKDIAKGKVKQGLQKVGTSSLKSLNPVTAALGEAQKGLQYSQAAKSFLKGNVKGGVAEALQSNYIPGVTSKVQGLLGQRISDTGKAISLSDEAVKKSGFDETANQAAIAAANQQAKDDEEAKRRSRRNNILTRPLGALTSNAVLTRVLTGQ